MSVNLKLALRDLRSQIDQNRPKEGEQWVEIIAGYFEDSTQTIAQIEYGIGLVLHAEKGSLPAFEATLGQSNLTKVSIALMQLYLHLIQEYKERTRSYAEGVMNSVLKFVLSSSTKALEKEVAIQIIRELIEKKFVGEEELPVLFNHLSGVMATKLTGRFAQKLYQCIGVILKDHPDQVASNRAVQFRDDMLTELEKFVCAGNTISFLVAAGALDALQFTLYNYAPDPSCEATLVHRIYGIVKRFCDPQNDDKGSRRASFHLFKTHVTLFGSLLLEDALEWHRWFQDIPGSTKDFMVPAIYAFYGQIAISIVEDINGDIEEKKRLLTKFIVHFKSILLDSVSKPFEIRLAIRSFGILSVPVKRFLPGDIVDDLVNIVISNTNFAYFSELADKRDKIEHLPDFIEALSLLIETMDGVSLVHIASLEKFIRALMQDFHFLSTYHHSMVVRSLCNTFHSVSKLGGSTAEDLLNRTMMHGILWTCSQKLPMDTFQEDVDWKDNITYKNYLPLWIGLLTAKGELQEKTSRMIGNALFKCLLEIIQRLDLTTVKRKIVGQSGVEEDAFFCDPESDLVPRQTSDFLIFFNLVSFYQDVLTNTSKDFRQAQLPNWFEAIVQELIQKSYEYPLVSGCMKLMETIFKISYKSFEEVADIFTPDLETNLREFIKIVIAKAKVSSGELQLACLKLIFKTPYNVLQQLFGDMVEVFELAFSIGKSVLWLTESALSCLSRNLRHCEDSDKDIMLRKVLPLFDNFLLSKSSGIHAEMDGKSNEVKKVPTRRNRIVVRPSDLTDEEMDLKRVQKKIILFLGTLEPDQCLYMMNSKTNQMHLTKWDIERNVKLALFVPDKDIKPEFVLDNLMPRVFHLANASTDRQTKIAACEFVHAIILYVIGSRQKLSKRLWVEIYKTMFTLACDADTAVQQMFEPLMIQVMHFKARPEQWSSENESRGVLVEVVMSCLCDATEPSLRDIAAKGLKELLSWTLEMANDKNEVVRTVFREIIQIITFNSLDCNVDRRLGAALAFNNIYKILRENELIIDLYWIMFFVAFTNSLYFECDDQSIKAFRQVKLEEQLENSIDHVERVIVEKWHILDVPNEERLKPDSMKVADFNGVITYVFELTRSPHSKLRAKSQRMFLKICPKKYPTIKDFLKRNFKSEDLIEIFNGKLSETMDLDCLTTDERTQSLRELRIVVNFQSFILESCGLSIDFKRSLISTSHIYKAVSQFLDFVLEDDSSWRALLERHTKSSWVKNTIHEIIDILSLTMDTERSIVTSFVNDNTAKLHKLISLICFGKLGNEQSKSSLQKLLLKMNSEAGQLRDFVSQVIAALKEQFELQVNVILLNSATLFHRDSISKSEVEDLKALRDVQELVHGLMPIAQDCIKSMQMAKALFDSITDIIHEGNLINPIVSTYANELLSLCLHENYSENTINMVLNAIVYEDVPKENGEITSGHVILSIFRTAIFEYIVNDDGSKELFKLLSSKITSATVTSFLQLSRELCLYANRIFSTEEGKAKRQILCNGLLKQWTQVFPLISSVKDCVNLINDYVSHLGLIAPMDLDLLGDELPGFEAWLLQELESKESSSDTKCKLLGLLPIITGLGTSTDQNKRLLKSLLIFKSKNMPHVSNEVQQNSLERAKMVVIMRTILDSVKISKSFALFEFLVIITSPDEDHLMELEIRKAASELIRDVKVKHQSELLDLSLKLFMKQSTPPMLRLNVFRRFIKSIIRACEKDVVKSFYEQLLSGPWKTCVLGKLINTSLDLPESESIDLVEVQREAIHSAIVNRMVGFHLIELLYGTLELEDMTKIALHVQFEKNTQPDKTRNMLTNLTTTCFRQTKEPQKYIYKHQPMNTLFRKYKCFTYRALCTIIMSTTTDITLYNKAVFNKDIWSHIIGPEEDLFAADFVSDFEEFPRMKERIISMKADVTTVDENEQKFKSLNTVYTSSLSQEVTKIDFTSRVFTTERRAINKTIRLEDLAMNAHDLMPTFCAIIQHLFDKKIMTSTVPDWVGSLANLMYAKDVQKNIRVFIGRLVENCKDLMKEYASTLFKGVLKLIVDECSGSKLNVYIMDLFNMLLQWQNHYKPESREEKELMVSAVEFLVRSCNHDVPEVMTMNLELARATVATWRYVLVDVFPRIMPQNLYAVRENSSSLCGLQLVAIFVTNDLQPWEPETQEIYLNSLLEHLHSTCKKSYKTAAHLIGHYLNKNGDHEDVVLTYLSDGIRKDIQKLIYIIFEIHHKYPAICNSYWTTIYKELPSSIKTLRVMLLTMLTSAAQPVKEIVAMGLLDMLKQRDYQLHVLLVIKSSIENFTEKDCNAILNDIQTASKSEKAESRIVAYEILSKFYLKTEGDTRTAVTDSLMRSFRDPDVNVQKIFLSFWSSNEILPTQLVPRLVKITEMLSEINNLDDYIEYVSQLLLDVLIMESNSTRPLISNETEMDNKLHEYEINVSWRSKNMSQTVPLFARSLSKSFVPGQSTLTFKDQTLDASGDLMFEPTQELATTIDHPPSIPTQSSFLFKTNSVSNPPNATEEYNPLKKRLIRDKEKSARNVAIQVIRKRGFEEQRKLYRRKDRSGKIVIYRRYRHGDFPDFLINFRAMFLPLQALVRNDPIVARKVFVGLFQSLIECMGDPSIITEPLQTAMKSIKECSGNVYGSFMELAFYHPKVLKMDVSVNISIHNNTSALAALVLENQITHYEDDNDASPSSKRKLTRAVNSETELWMNVADLYKSTKDIEIVSGIFSEKLDSDPRLVVAIELENNGFYQKAQRTYLEIINSLETVAEVNSLKHLEKNYCFEALFNCYLEMGMWNDSVQQVTDQLGDWEKLWEEEWNQENLLPNIMHSQLRLALSGDRHQAKDFLRCLDSWMMDKERNHILKIDFSQELVMFHMTAKNHLAARVLTEENIWNFTNEWGQLSVLSDNIRRQKLLNIRTIAEVDVYLEILTKFTPNVDNPIFQNVLTKIPQRWASSLPQKSDSLLMWDLIFACRSFVGTLLYNVEYEPVQKSNFLMSNKLFSLAVAQKNVAFADRILVKLLADANKLGSEMQIINCTLAKCSAQILKASMRSGEKGVQNALSAIDTLDTIDKEMLLRNMDYFLSNTLEIVNLSEAVLHITRLGNRNISSDVQRSVQDRIWNVLKESIAVAEEMPSQFTGQQQINNLRDIHVKMAQYALTCLDRLSENQDECIEDIRDERERLYEIIIKSIFDSLTFGSEDGQKLFPYTLKFKKNPLLKTLFVEKCRQVPVSMFLKWIPQILSHLNYEKENYLDDLIIRIAEMYPTALYFPFLLSYEQYRFQTLQPEIRPLVAKIQSLIYDPKMEQMVKGLSSVCLPQVMFTAHINDLLRTLKIRRDRTFRNHLNRTIETLFPSDLQMRGRKFRAFSSTSLKQKFVDLLRYDAASLNHVDSLRLSLESLKAKLTSHPSTSTTELEDLCPWLAMYTSMNGSSVEIPGQFFYHTTAVKPVTIQKFGKKIGIFGSKTRPVRIKMYGSDGKQYDFLMKYGEDLRQDQRIQQIFKIMSDCLAKDIHCLSMNLNIITYNVVPISSYFGMLSWVPDTVPVQEFVQKAMCGDSEKLRKFADIQVEFNSFLQNTKLQPIWEVFANVVEKETPIRLKTKFRELAYKFPPDLLRQAIVDISASPESFYMLRNNFSRSMATMNIAHWILGVGDRHLLNILMNVKTCHLIGIDFNVVFESGCRVLPIPELIPFRLTPQFVNVMSPFGVTGTIKSAMIHSLKVFRNEQKLLKACLEVFIREPTMDWVCNAIFVQDEEAEFNTLSTDTRVHWEPSDRLAAVSNKLEGINPVLPIMNALDKQAGFLNTRPAAVAKYKDILMGDSRSIRKRLPMSGLTVEQQVKSLIDLATDEAVLGITFMGLFPWL